MIYFKHEVKWGPIIIGLTEKGEIAGLWFEGQKYFPEIPPDAIWIESEPVFTEHTIEKDNKMYLQHKKFYPIVKETIKQLKEYENGIRWAFDLALNPKGTDFRQVIWEEILKIPCGKTLTYGEISQIVAHKLRKQTMSAQAVGGAVGHNPISIIIPCHRVLGAGGDLRGYAGGIDKKVALLAHEKEMVNAKRRHI